MALLFMDGFDNYNTQTNLSQNGWAILDNGNTPCSFVAGQYPTNTGLAINWISGYNTGLIRGLGSNLSTVICGTSLNASTLDGNGSTVFFGLCDSDGTSNTIQIMLVANANLNNILVYRGNTSSNLIGSTPAGSLICGIWQYVELQATISSSVGAITIRVNGITVLNLSNVNTQVTANAYCNSVMLNCAGVSGDLTPNGDGSCGAWDDFYICDTTGSAPTNTFLGDVRVTTLFPTADGSQDDFTPNGLTPNYLNVNTPNPNSLINYNSSNTPTDLDLFTVSTLNNYTIFGTAMMTYSSKDDAGERSIANLIREGATDYQLPTSAVSSVGQYDYGLMAINPITSAAWTSADIANLQIGYTIIT